MRIETKTSSSVTPDDVAQVLYECTPDEFAAVWFALAERVNKEKTKVSFVRTRAEPMAADRGGIRKKLLGSLMRTVVYFEELREGEK